MTTQPVDLSAFEGATEGPYLAAAGPSSIVGWPVVARGGSLVCDVAWAGHAEEDHGDGADDPDCPICMMHAALRQALTPNPEREDG